MGGGDKPLLPLAGRPLLVHVLDRLRPQVAAVVLSANGDPARFAAAAPGLPVVPDGLEGNPGPLAGILAAMEFAAAHRPDLPWLLSVPGDTPLIPPDLAARLHRASEAAGAPLACAASGGRAHPAVGLWPVALRNALRKALLGGERRVDAWSTRHGRAEAAWEEAPDPFLNVNQPEDLTVAEAALRAATRAGRPDPA